MALTVTAIVIVIVAAITAIITTIIDYGDDYGNGNGNGDGNSKVSIYTCIYDLPACSGLALEYVLLCRYQYQYCPLSSFRTTMYIVCTYIVVLRLYCSTM